MHCTLNLACVVLASSLVRPPLGWAATIQEKPAEASADGAALNGLDDFVQNAMGEWKVPGLAVAVIQNDKVIHIKGYGMRDVENKLPVTPDTLFAIGSISKSFTATCLGTLVDDGKLQWDTPIVKYLPDFQLHDRAVTQQVTARDLITHRSGLPRHDFVWYADPNRNRSELYARLRFLEPSKEFRSSWQYQNLMFMTAGVLAERITGQTWEQFTRSRILDPIGMPRSNFSVNDSQKSDDFARPYSKVKNSVKLVPFHNIDAVGPAGSINSSVAEMIKYVQMHIDKGKFDDKQLLSAGQAEQMQAPQMVMPSSAQSPRDEELGDLSYGLGFMISSYRGTKSVEHGGGIDGFISLLSFLPRKKIGVIVLTNMSGANPVPMLVTRNVFDRLMGFEPIDWMARVKETVKRSELAQEEAGKREQSDRKEGTATSHPLADYAGSYEHPAYGIMKVEYDASALKVAAPAGPSAALRHFHYDVFVTEEDGTAPLAKTKISFLYNKQGDIDRLTVPFEPSVADIVFTRMPDESLRKKETLLALAGEYQLGVVTVTLALRGDDTLTLTVPGQPTYELVPTRNFSFDLKGLAGYRALFKRDASGAVTEVAFVQPNGTFVAKRKAQPGSKAANQTGVTANDSGSRPQPVTSRAAPGARAPGWTPDVMMSVRRVASVRPSPDGQRVAYAVTEPVMTTERSEYVTQIHLASADGSNPLQLTYNEKSSTNPQWSPDSQRLAFTSDRSGKNNLYVLLVGGGEAQQITDLKSDVVAFAWAPDGQSIAFTMADPKADDDAKNEKGKDDSRWVDENPKLNRLYIVPVHRNDTGERPVRKLTEGNYHVATSTRFGTRDFDWSPDGRSIAFAHTTSPKADDWTKMDVSIIDVTKGTVTSLASTSAAEFCPVFSPNGQSIALMVSDAPPTWAGSYSVQIVPAQGGSVRTLPATRDQQPAVLGWSDDGNQIYFTETRGTVTRISTIAVQSGEVVDLNSGNEVIAAVELNRTGKLLGFASHMSHQAPEAFVTRTDRFLPVQVSQANAGLPTLPLGKVEVVRWKSFDGVEIEGILTYPAHYEPGARVPLLLQVHGGPAGVFTRGFEATPSLYPNAAFAQLGYAILRPNPRGSSGYGKEFRYANYKDWGGGDYRDIIAGVDHVVEMGLADPERLGVMGWSYGGYMTSWIVTQTDRFKAASVGAGVTNLASFTGTSDIPGFLPDYLGAQPWQNLDLYRSRSAVINAGKIKTPTLVQHGEADVRVPVSQGYEFYNALKQQGVPTRMLVLPRQPHGPIEPKMMLKVMQTNLEWFDKYLRPSAEPGVAKVGEIVTAAQDHEASNDEFIRAEMQKRNIPGAAVAVLRNGELLRAQGYGLANVELNVPVSTSTVFQLQSITKTFTAAATLMLVEQGAIRLDDKITQYLSDLPEAWHEITVRQLLSHTSGLKDFINEPTVNLRLDAAPAEIIKSLADKPLNFTPGEKFRYSNTGYQLLGMIIAKVSGKEWGTFLHETLFAPLGMTDTRVVVLNELVPNRAAGYLNIRGRLQNGNFIAPSILSYPGGGIQSTVVDLSKWAAALDTERLLKASTLEMMWTPARLSDGSTAPYGLGWFLGNYQDHRFVQHTGSHMTGFGTALTRFPDDRLSVIVLTNQNGSNSAEIANKLASRYFAPPVSPPAASGSAP